MAVPNSTEQPAVASVPPAVAEVVAVVQEPQAPQQVPAPAEPQVVAGQHPAPPAPQPIQQQAQPVQHAAQAHPVSLEAAQAAKAERNKLIRARAFKAVIAGTLVLIAIAGFRIAGQLSYQSCIQVASMKYGTASASSLAGVARRNAVAQCSSGIL